MDQDINKVIEIVQKEHRSTRRVFGISIIILALLLMILAPGIIRIESQHVSEPAIETMPEHIETATTSPEGE